VQHHCAVHARAFVRMCARAFAGLVAQTLTQPLHVVRRRMQVQVGARIAAPVRARVRARLRACVDSAHAQGLGGRSGSAYRGVWHAFQRIYETEGLR
jgi:hypothetical protein